ncbi:alpha-ketoglutarate decarboxylase [Aquimarina sp. AD10]|uniref:alpha-ketoglutarate decarboxylase n=1 Tax=Aquimarina sp. AD10 TaxID=1714849 RepID=UPI000E4EE3A3|nr:alpha-ketoglutarate decarboxylase [Aquimarina sp. AD10]AXT61325.1 alpha-ketoglutarate decarboxylase [Aquimarina sp. AD10]RKN01480.1 alpha-ketoglutarate decarboxylase [Aquimarina sp. AD10]
MKDYTNENSKILILVFIIIFSLQKVYSQDQNFWSNVRFGGNIGIGFSGDTFNGVIAPSAVYDFNQWFSAGLGLHFGYTDGLNFIATNYGASIITLYSPFQELQLSAEFEQMGVNRSFDTDVRNNVNTISQNYWYPALFLGAGYRTGFVSIGIRYDVLYDDDKSIYASPYSPFVRVFF